MTEKEGFGGYIELTQLKHVITQSKKDPNEVIISIPVNLNNLEFAKYKENGVLKEDKTKIRIPWQMWKMPENKGSEFSVKLNWPEELREKVKKENEGKEANAKVYAPNLGYANRIEKKNHPAEQSPEAQALMPDNTEDDLPF